MSKDDKISRPAEGQLATQASYIASDTAIDTASLPINSLYKESIASYVKLADVQQLIQKTAKHTKPAYRRAIDRRKVDEWGYRLDRVLKRLRRSHSVEGYKDIVRAFSNMSEFERRYFIKKMELSDGR